MTYDKLIIPLSLMVVACGDVSNSGDRERTVHDLSRFQLQTTAPPAQTGYRVAQITAQRSIPKADALFFRSGDLWTFSLDGTDVEFSQVAVDGSIVTSHRLPVATVGNIRGATADANGDVWVTRQTEEIEILDLATGTAGRRLTLPMTVVALAAHGTSLFAAGSNRVVELDLATGTMINDYAAQFERDLGPYGINGLAVTSDRILLTVSQRIDAILIDRQTGDSMGFAGGIPAGIRGRGVDRRAEGIITGAGQHWLGVLETGTAVEFSLSPPLPGLAFQRAAAAQQSGAVALTIISGNIWILYQDQASGELALVEYDPSTLAAKSAYLVDPTTAAELQDESMGYELLSLGHYKGEIYLASLSHWASPDVPGTRVRVLDHATGSLLRAYDMAPVVSGLCFDDQGMLVAETVVEAGVGLHTPKIHRVDPLTGIQQSSFDAPFEVNSLPSLICTADGVVISGDATRRWGRTNAAGNVGLFSAPVPTAGTSGAATPKGMWLLDSSRNLLFETSLPAPVAP